MRPLFIVCMGLLLTNIASDARKLVDRKKYHKFEEIMNENEILNVCNLHNYRELNINCFCNSVELQNATDAQCWLFNDSEKEDSFIWDEFRSQSKIKQLKIIVRSSLSFVPTKTLTHLPHLTTFSIVYGNISSIVPYAFANLTSLETLTLNNNQINVLEKYSIANLPSLEEVNLDQNQLKEIGRDMFKNLPSLKKLYLKENEIHVVQDLAFAELSQLEELEMYKNQITDISRNTFAGLKSLKRLDLHANLLSELKDFTFAEMPNLQELIIEQNMIENVGEKVFYGIKHLQRLILAENKLHILPDDVFSSLPYLRKLDLRDNLLQTFTYNTAVPILDKLKNESFYFLIEGNRLECDCNLSWFRRLANETANEQLKSKLRQLSCYMKGNYYADNDNDQELHTNGLSDNGILRDGVADDSRHRENVPDNVDRMLKLFNIPLETLPCPEKRQANEILMEQKSKNEVNASTRISIPKASTFCIAILFTLTIFR